MIQGEPTMRLASTAVLLTLLAGPAFAADVTGTWMTPTDEGIVEIKDCGSSVCGTLVSSDDIKKKSGPDRFQEWPMRRSATARSRACSWLSGFTGSGGSWSGGKIYNPDDGNDLHRHPHAEGRQYAGSARLRVRALCQTQTWTRGQVSPRRA